MAIAFDAQAAISALKTKGLGKYVCPCCGGRKFSVHNEAATLSVSDQLNVLKIGNYVPAAILICDNCGNLQFFALAKLGLISEKGGDSR